MYKFLLKKGANPNPWPNTHFHAAAIFRDMRHLNRDTSECKNPIDINTQNPIGDTALMMACYRFPTFIDKFLELGASPFIINYAGETALHRLLKGMFRVAKPMLRNIGSKTWMDRYRQDYKTYFSRNLYLNSFKKICSTLLADETAGKELAKKAALSCDASGQTIMDLVIDPRLDHENQEIMAIRECVFNLYTQLGISQCTPLKTVLMVDAKEFGFNGGDYRAIKRLLEAGAELCDVDPSLVEKYKQDESSPIGALFNSFEKFQNTTTVLCCSLFRDERGEESKDFDPTRLVLEYCGNNDLKLTP